MQKKYSTNQNEINRRDFLKQFAMMSAISLGTAAGCSNSSDEPEPHALYGPAPYSGPEVDNMFYLLPDGSEVLLYDTEEINIDSQFKIYFYEPMYEGSQNSVTLEGGDNPPVTLIFQWEEDFTVLKVTPETPLLDETQYTLSVNENALAADGTPINLTESAQAEFKTSST